MEVREKLVELLQSAPADITGNHGVGALADHLIAHGVTVQEWISVDDRLPEHGAHVLLCCEMRRYGGEIAGKYVCDG